MQDRLRQLLPFALAAAGWAARNGSNLVFVAALAGLAYGLWLWSEPLAWVVPSGFVLVCLVVGRLRPEKEDRPDA